VLFAFEEMVKEAALHGEPIRTVVLRPFRPPVCVHPLVGGCDVLEPIKRSLTMKVMIGEAGADKGRYLDLLSGLVARIPPVGAERSSSLLPSEIDSVLSSRSVCPMGPHHH